MGKIQKSDFKKSIIKTFIAVFILLIVILSAGIAYTWYLSKDTVRDSSVLDSPVDAAPKTTPPLLDPNSPVGASVQSLSSLVVLGEQASMIVKTRPMADCSVISEYDKKTIIDLGLTTKKADDYGVASWDWFMKKGSPIGKWLLKITCKYGDKSGYVEGEMVVKG